MNEKTEARLVKIYENLVWIEADMSGSRHVMVQSTAPDMKPFRYATFYYRYGYTDNASLRSAAIEVAETMTDARPIEERFALPNAVLSGKPRTEL